MGPRVGIYIRVSTIQQSTELQLNEIQSFLKARNWLDWKVFEDKQSGTNMARPALRELLHAVRERKLDIVICWKMDRLFRSLQDLIGTIHEFKSLGVDFISLKDQIDLTTPSGRLLVHLLGAFAEFEAALIKERVCSGLAKAKAKGVRLGRPAVISESEAIELRNQGLSLNQIAKRLGVTKSAVSKTLKKHRWKNQLINVDNTQIRNPGCGVEETKDLETQTISLSREIFSDEGKT